MSEQVPREKSWVPVGYLAANRDKNLTIIMISDEPGEKKYFIADLGDSLEVLSGRRPFTKVLLRKR